MAWTPRGGLTYDVGVLLAILGIFNSRNPTTSRTDDSCSDALFTAPESVDIYRAVYRWRVQSSLILNLGLTHPTLAFTRSDNDVRAISRPPVIKQKFSKRKIL